MTFSAVLKPDAPSLEIFADHLQSTAPIIRLCEPYRPVDGHRYAIETIPRFAKKLGIEREVGVSSFQDGIRQLEALLDIRIQPDWITPDRDRESGVQRVGTHDPEATLPIYTILPGDVVMIPAVTRREYRATVVQTPRGPQLLDAGASAGAFTAASFSFSTPHLHALPLEAHEQVSRLELSKPMTEVTLHVLEPGRLARHVAAVDETGGLVLMSPEGRTLQVSDLCAVQWAAMMVQPVKKVLFEGEIPAFMSELQLKKLRKEEFASGPSAS